MKALPYIFTSALALAALIAVTSTPASGASNWDAMGEINKLKEQVAELTSKVTALESQIRVADQKTITVTYFPQSHFISTQQPLIQVTPQEDILKVLKRGMFVPANR